MAGDMRRREEEAAAIMAMVERGEIDESRLHGYSPPEMMTPFFLAIMGFAFGLLYGFVRIFGSWIWQAGCIVHAVWKERSK